MIESPIKAPQDKLNINLSIISKHGILQHFLAMISMTAAKNPILEMPNPAKKPKPHT